MHLSPNPRYFFNVEIQEPHEPQPEQEGAQERHQEAQGQPTRVFERGVSQVPSKPALCQEGNVSCRQERLVIG